MHALFFIAIPLLVAACAQGTLTEDRGQWLATWTSAQQLVEPRNLPPEPGFNDATLRQIVRVSVGGERFRLKLSNAFGWDELDVVSVHVALAVQPGTSAIVAGTDQTVTFGGQSAVTVPPGALVVSDPVPTSIDPRTDLAISIHFRSAGERITGHPGSRTTSFLRSGDGVEAETLPDAAKVEHWYFLSGVEVWTKQSVGAIAILGDSITDGRGSTTDGNDRWPDQLLRRLQDDAQTARIAVLNQGIGGNRMLRDGLGPNVLARFDRDVLAQPGVRWLIVFEGINDLGTANGARRNGQPFATAPDIIRAYEQIILRAHAHGIHVYGGTITPCGSSFYDTPELEADRLAINVWIRTSGTFDAVIDFDAAVRDPQDPSRLAAAYDTGDHLHLNPAGYAAMAGAVDLKLFRE